jgi:hypothetical protein
MSYHLCHRNRGMMIQEMAVVLGGLAMLGLIIAGVAHERRAAQQLERRAAALETAQDLLTQARHGLLVAPAGWAIDRTQAGPAIMAVRVRGEGVTLSTVVPGTVPVEAGQP